MKGISKMAVTDIAWTVPFILPFIIGILVGFIIRRTVKLAFLVVALALILATFGYISVTYGDIYDQAQLILPVILGIKNIFPYMSTTFILGLVFGLWKG